MSSPPSKSLYGLGLSPGVVEGTVHTAHSLDDLARNRLPKVARDLGESVEEVKELAAILRRDFDPFPGRRFEHVPLRRVRPDVVVEKVDGRYQVVLEDDSMPRLSVDELRVRAMRKKGFPLQRLMTNQKALVEHRAQSLFQIYALSLLRPRFHP